MKVEWSHSSSSEEAPKLKVDPQNYDKTLSILVGILSKVKKPKIIFIRVLDFWMFEFIEFFMSGCFCSGCFDFQRSEF